MVFDGHWNNVFAPYVFKTTDYGKSWANIGSSLPQNEVVRVIREDPKNPNLLFIGTETGVWYSLNGGKAWTRCMPNLPTVSVYDLAIHPRDGDLIAGTHGRSIWIMDDISALQQMNPEIAASPAWLFSQRPAIRWDNVSRGGQRGHFWFAGENPPTVINTSSLPRAGFANQGLIHYYVGEPSTDSLELEISDLSGRHFRKVKLPAEAGIQRYTWDLKFDPVPYTADQLVALEQLFKELLERYPMNTLNQAYNNFKRASGPAEQRRVIESLRTGVLSLAISDEYGLPTASEGAYLLKLRHGEKEWRQTLLVRNDPQGK